MEQEYKTFIGSKFFKCDDNGNVIDIVRVCKYDNNTDHVSVINDLDKSKIKSKKKMNLSELYRDYSQLTPHAIINFCIATCGSGTEDVIVMMHRYKDLLSDNPVPYCVLRQSITDLFANTIIKSNKMYTGCCVSLDTCPEGIDYQIMVACNSINKSTVVAAYMDDTLDSILELVKVKDYDLTLGSLFTDHINYECKSNPVLAGAASIIKSKDSYDGYCKTLRKLMEENNFMYDFYMGFDIIPVNFEITYDKDGVLCEKATQVLEYFKMVNIKSTLTLDYWYDIDLDSIQNTYCLMIDSTNTLYVVAYVSNGRKHIELEKTESIDNIMQLVNDAVAGNNKSVKEAYEMIQINKNKYN